MLVRYALSQTKCRRACPSHPNVIAPCSIACQSPSHMLISPQARRVMPARLPNALAHAHLAEMLSCYAHSRAKRSRACSSQRNLIAPCPLVCQSSSRTLPPSTISLQRTRFAQRDRSWSKREKQIAHTAFEQALAREAAALVAEVRAKAQAITELDDLWQLEQFLREKRHALEQHYDYRYSVLLYVFADLIQAGWLSLDELAGLADDKRARVAALLEIAREDGE